MPVAPQSPTQRARLREKGFFRSPSSHSPPSHSFPVCGSLVPTPTTSAILTIATPLSPTPTRLGSPLNVSANNSASAAARRMIMRLISISCSVRRINMACRRIPRQLEWSRRMMDRRLYM
ncbi:hypothetical protein I7I48_09426 [Histoplasma ohiense]|nr:hypothetical protein I7I48_09426 [Histoplasma ohiense (nom. inval.)]